MTRLLLIRHGSTAWNAEKRYQGQTDTRLSESGRQQALQVAERLQTETLDALYASDLRRARKTAEPIAAYHQLVVQPEPRLREVSFGEWEGHTHAEIEQRDSASLAGWFDDPIHRSPPGGETLREVAGRVGAAYDDLLDLHPDETVAVVGHGGTLRVLICHALGVRLDSYWQFRFDVASLSELNTYEDGAVLTTLNDTTHLHSGTVRPSPQISDAPTETAARGSLRLVLGGARSGKSDFAQQWVEDMSHSHEARPSRVLFVATAEARDKEMEQRIENHRRIRPDHWHTLEAPRHVGWAILDVATEVMPTVILVDCMTLLTSNLLLEAEEVETALMDEVDDLIACAEQLPVPIVVVSNEVGWGLVPPYPLGRAYRDLLGRANQALAEAADEVILLVAGIPNVIKG